MQKRSLIVGLCVCAAAGCSGSGSGAAGLGSGYAPLDFVTATKYSKILIEVDYEAGAGARQGALDGLLSVLDELRASGHLGKPGGVRVVVDEALPAGDPAAVRTFEELDALERAHRTLAPEAGEAVIHVVYAAGHYQDDTDQASVLGFAWGGGAIVMLPGNIERACEAGLVGLLPGVSEKVCTLSEASVLVHEVGHLFGLVDNGLPMAQSHVDAAHGKHDVNDRCIMYWANERSSVIALAAERVKKGDEDVSPFDDACLADLKAAQP